MPNEVLPGPKTSPAQVGAAESHLCEHFLLSPQESELIQINISADAVDY